METSHLLSEIRAACPSEELGFNIPLVWEDYCGATIRTYTRIFSNEGAVGAPARASLNKATSKFKCWPLEMVFYSQKYDTTLMLHCGMKNGHPPHSRCAPHGGGAGNLVWQPDFHLRTITNPHLNRRGWMSLGKSIFSPS